nr:30S ribosomal protein S6 [Patescibacteria group bacterium]
ESFDAKITAEKEYLKRKLSYEINHERYGFFTVLRFEIKDKDKIQELKKSLNIDESVSRYIIVQASELPSLEEQAKIESNIQRKDTLKQEEIEQALAEESKKVSQTKKEESSSASSSAKATADKKVTADKEEEVIPVAEEKNPPADEEEVKEKEEVVKEENVKQEDEKEDEKKKEDEEEKDNASLDELDKKLDEILNL